MVERVEHLHLELEFYVLAIERRHLRDTDIEVGAPRPVEEVAWQRPVSPARRVSDAGIAGCQCEGQ